MANAHVLVCDATVPAVRTIHPHPYTCTARSRAAATDVVLRAVAARDGWVRDGARDLCPFHAAEATP